MRAGWREHVRNQSRLHCRDRGFVFGRLSADRRPPEFTPGFPMAVDTTRQRADGLCPRCGQRRSFTDVVFSALAMPRMPLKA